MTTLHLQLCPTMKSKLHLPLALVAASLLAPVGVHAASRTEIRTFTVGGPAGEIPDVQDPPLMFVQDISDSGIVSITAVEVGLHLVGGPTGYGFAGEMFVSLTKDLSLGSILINQPGVTLGDAAGYSYEGWDVVLSDAGALDIHGVAADSGVLGGTYQPDGRANPTDTDRTLLLDVFDGSPGNGSWSLNIADLASGGRMQLVEWTLTLVGDGAPLTEVPVVPEPASLVAGAIAALVVVGRSVVRRRAARC